MDNKDEISNEMSNKHEFKLKNILKIMHTINKISKS